MESFPYWALSRGFGNRHPNVVSHAVRFPIPPSRFFGTAYGARVMLSTPPATNTSPSPVLTARAGDREPGEEGRHPGDVPVVLSRLVRTAEIHFVHEGGVHARASHDLAHDERPEVIRPDVLERALVSAHRGPHSAHDHRFRHSGIPRIAPSHGRI